MDALAMQRCLELARQGQGFVGNGALVGAVLVREGRIIAEGFHEGFGLPHAERSLLQKFDQKILQEDVLYVNLEPCVHHGKTPPCTDMIIEKGVKNICIGMLDPDPRVSGKGIETLRKARVKVRGPILRAECEYLNRGFVSVRTRGRPWITLKRALSPTPDPSPDGGGEPTWRIANEDGSPMRITSPEQDLWSHEFLRARHDAILVGVETVLRDDPQLTVRHVMLRDDPACQTEESGAKRRTSRSRHAGSPQHDMPWRIILDPQCRIPLDATVVTDVSKERTIIVTSKRTNIDQTSYLQSGLNANHELFKRRGIRVVEVPLNDGKFVFEELWKILTVPSEDFYGITSILVEGGAKTWEIFRQARLVDEEVILVD